jgi:hypothetical protein
LGPETTSVKEELEKTGDWPKKTLNPNAKCFYPSSIELTMMTEVESEKEIDDKITIEIKGEDKVKETPIVWNLKGRSIDDILVDLEALKNDPEIPMPIIEADPASAEDFEQYTRVLKE